MEYFAVLLIVIAGVAYLWLGLLIDTNSHTNGNNAQSQTAEAGLREQRRPHRAPCGGNSLCFASGDGKSRPGDEKLQQTGIRIVLAAGAAWQDYFDTTHHAALRANPIGGDPGSAWRRDR